jgi:hypothetical protein
VSAEGHQISWPICQEQHEIKPDQTCGYAGTFTEFWATSACFVLITENTDAERKTQQQQCYVWGDKKTFDIQYGVFISLNQAVIDDVTKQCEDSSKIAEHLATYWDQYKTQLIFLRQTSGANVLYSTAGELGLTGEPETGADTKGQEGQLTEIAELLATERAFAAKTQQGEMYSWGDPAYGGEQPQALSNIKALCATQRAFAVLNEQGKPFSWGGVDFQVDSMLQFKHVVSTDGGFAALTENGKVYSWGQPYQRSDDTQPYYSVPEALDAETVVQLTSTKGAFIARTEAGQVISWDDPIYNAANNATLDSDGAKALQDNGGMGGDSQTVTSFLEDADHTCINILTTDFAAAAICQSNTPEKTPTIALFGNAEFGAKVPLDQSGKLDLEKMTVINFSSPATDQKAAQDKTFGSDPIASLLFLYAIGTCYSFD